MRVRPSRGLMLGHRGITGGPQNERSTVAVVGCGGLVVHFVEGGQWMNLTIN